MPTYVSLLNWTEQGVRTVKDLPQRIADFRQMAQGKGATLREVFVTMGQYDVVGITEAPSDKVAARLMLALAGRGNTRTTTLKASTEAEIPSLLQGLP